MTFIYKLSNLEIVIADLSNAYANINSPYSFSNTAGNLNIVIAGSNNDEITLSSGRYVLYAVPYATTSGGKSTNPELEYSWQVYENSSFSNKGSTGKTPVATDSSGQNTAALLSIDVYNSATLRLKITNFIGSATDSGGYVRICRSDL